MNWYMTGSGCILTHTKGYLGDSRYSVARPTITAKLGANFPSEFVGFDIGFRFNYIFDIPETNFYYSDGGNAAFFGVEIGVLFRI